MGGRVRLIAVVVAVLLLGGCGVRSGAAESESGWRTKVDQTLGTAVSSLGTTALLLENRADGHLTTNYVVVAVRDALRTLNTEAQAFESLQPPASEAAANRRAVEALGRAVTAVNAASTAVSAGDRGAVHDALRDVRRTYAALQDLRDRLTKAAR
ncbi:hypothetical protein [Nocardioides luteus]|uniref:hypothetical protein n=1 Tax=Nocardioides luteus TaxID=1844 RepID=UPI00115F7AF9|nr:hypothetical protein [Nocardioides luteus]